MVPGQPALNTSSALAVHFIDGEMKEIDDTFTPSVDVRDVAEAHVAALDIEDAFGKRFVMVGDVPHNRDIAALIREAVPDNLKEKVPTAQATKDVPPTPFIFDCSPTLNILDIKMRKSADMFGDTVKQLIENGFDSRSHYVPGK